MAVHEISLALYGLLKDEVRHYCPAAKYLDTHRLGLLQGITDSRIIRESFPSHSSHLASRLHF